MENQLLEWDSGFTDADVAVVAGDLLSRVMNKWKKKKQNACLANKIGSQWVSKNVELSILVLKVKDFEVEKNERGKELIHRAH